MAASAASTPNPTPDEPDVSRVTTPVCLVLGMAGSGKTTLVDALSSWLEDEDEITAAMSQLRVEGAASEPQNPSTASVDTPVPSTAAEEHPAQHPDRQSEDVIPTESLFPGEGAYVINLDPAVYELPYEPNIDIRDTVKYKEVMKEYSLGPNGAIITSLNLYATRFDQVLSLVEKRAKDVKAVVVDTPGQIETFTWSASGAIITDAFGMILPTIVIFVVDTKRCESAMTFVSNMLYACSIMYKTRLPLVVAFNKIDVISCKFAQAWMQDFDKFDAVLKEENFVGTLARSMAMALEEFYKTMRTVAVSAQTGEGLIDLMRSVQEASEEYERDYRPVVEERKRAKDKETQERMKRDLNQFRKDAADEIGNGSAANMPDAASPDDEVRLERMKGADVDDSEENREYQKFLQKFGDAGKMQQ